MRYASFVGEMYWYKTSTKFHQMKTERNPQSSQKHGRRRQKEENPGQIYLFEDLVDSKKQDNQGYPLKSNKRNNEATKSELKDLFHDFKNWWEQENEFKYEIKDKGFPFELLKHKISARKGSSNKRIAKKQFEKIAKKVVKNYQKEMVEKLTGENPKKSITNPQFAMNFMLSRSLEISIREFSKQKKRDLPLV